MTNNNFYQASCGVKRQIVPNIATSKAIIKKNSAFDTTSCDVAIYYLELTLKNNKP